MYLYMYIYIHVYIYVYIMYLSFRVSRFLVTVQSLVTEINIIPRLIFCNTFNLTYNLYMII